MGIKNIVTYLILFNPSPICSHSFSYQTLSLYLLFDMSYNFSHLRTNSVNFSSISEDKNRPHSLQTNTRSVVEETLDCSHYQIEQAQTGSDPSRHVKTSSLRNVDGTELRREGDVPVSVNISV